MINTFTLPTRIVYGDGSTNEIGNTAHSAGFRHAMIVTDPRVQYSGLVATITNSLQVGRIAVSLYDKVSPNPRAHECSVGAETAAREKADLVVAVGGGSVIDAAKAMSILVANGGTIEDYVPSLGGQRTPRSMLTTYAIPTTCGSGAEVSPTAIITLTNNAHKITLRPCAPAIAFIDPLLVMNMPPLLTASTGMDALAHSIEASISPDASPYTDIFAVQAIRMITSNLRQAVQSTGDSRHDPIAAMMYAANLAGFSLKAGMGQPHSMAHALGGVLDLRHAEVVAIMLPSVLRYHLDRIAPRLAELAPLMNLHTSGSDQRQSATRVIDLFTHLRTDLGLPGCLADLEVSSAHLPILADRVMSTDEAWRRQRPCPCSRDDVLAMYASAL